MLILVSIIKETETYFAVGVTIFKKIDNTLDMEGNSPS